MNDAKISNRTVKALETKKKIYESAERLFKKHGFEHVSVDSIVETVGVSKGAFYVHFSSKDALIAALIADYVENLDLDYRSFLASFEHDRKASDKLIFLAGKIAEIIDSIIGYDHMKFIYGAQLMRTINIDVVSSYNRDIYKIFSDIISQGVVQGEFKTDVSPEVIAKHYLVALRGLVYEWCIRYPDYDLRAETRKHFEILLTGIKK